MREYSGIGLAAPQVHSGLRVFVAGLREGDVGQRSRTMAMPFMALINPELTMVGEATDEGGRAASRFPTSADSCRARRASACRPSTGPASA